MDPYLHGAPPLAESGGEKEAWGSPAPLWGPGSCEHHGLHSSPLVFLSHCLGRDGPGQGSVPSLISPWGADSGNLSCSSCPVSPVSVSAGSLSQPVLTQPASPSAYPGASARLTCTLSSGYRVGGYQMSCFQQKAGSPPWYLLMFKSDSDKPQGSGVPSHFSGSKAASANTGLLLISGLQTQDEADYNCYCPRNTGIYQVLRTAQG